MYYYINILDKNTLIDKNTVPAIVMLYKNTKVKALTPDEDTD